MGKMKISSIFWFLLKHLGAIAGVHVPGSRRNAVSMNPKCEFGGEGLVMHLLRAQVESWGG